MYISKLASNIDANILQVLEKRRIQLVSQGVDIINLSVGTPDRPPAAHVMQAISEASSNPENYKYTLIDPPALVESVQNWYKKRYSVDIAPDEML
jgi:LL-diaminopimelate aminotransferase